MRAGEAAGIVLVCTETKNPGRRGRAFPVPMRSASELVAQAAADDIDRGAGVGAEDDREAVRRLGEVVVQISRGRGVDGVGSNILPVAARLGEVALRQFATLCAKKP